jgi:hypothetical protein
MRDQFNFGPRRIIFFKKNLWCWNELRFVNIG